MKICKSCYINKEYENFSKRTENIDKLSNDCKDCQNIKNNIKNLQYKYEDKKNILGKSFNNIIIIRFSKRYSSNGISKNYFIVKCFCGNEFEAREDNIKSQNTKSCGCLHTKHNLQKHPIYSNYNQMMQRCYNKNNKNYNYCGAKGIIVYDNWKNNPEAYIKYIEENLGPKIKGYSIDRINNNGNYEPGNIRWATRDQQAQNTSKNKIDKDIAIKIYVEYHTSSIKQTDLAKKYNIAKHSVYQIIHRRQWDNFTSKLNLIERVKCH